MSELTAVALVPMRHTSERVPGKNYREFAGRPLYRHIVETLLDCPHISQVVIDTDSQAIREDAHSVYGERVTLIERPEHLRDGDIAMNDVLLHTIEQVPAEWYLQTHSTNPLLSSSTIERALTALADDPARDSLFSVTRLQTRLWTSTGEPMNHDPAKLLRTQDLPPVLEENSNMYVFRGTQLRETGNRIGANPLLFEIDRNEAWDIDDEVDFLVAEFLFRRERPSR